MKKLRQYFGFDLRGFLAAKTLVALSSSPWKGEKGEILGSRVETVIVKDETDYGTPGVTNLYKKIIVKIPKTDFAVPSGAQVEIVNGVGSVYGDYSQNLSVKADDVKVIGGKQ